MREVPSPKKSIAMVDTMNKSNAEHELFYFIYFNGCEYVWCHAVIMW